MDDEVEVKVIGSLVSIYVAPGAGQPMVQVNSVNTLRKQGLLGDRYQIGNGAYSNGKREAVRSISLISTEAIARVADGPNAPFLPEHTRRNLLVSVSIEELNALVGKKFWIGGVGFEGTELCDPCARPSKLCGIPGFAQLFDGMGGLRAEVLDDGSIEIGHEVLC